MYNNDSIYDLVRKAQENYTSGETTISKYVNFSQYENIERIDAYLNSKHTSGETDSMGREKPFFNIVTAAVNIWYRATDIDRKNIRIKPTKQKNIVEAYLATIHLQEWMRKESFGTFLNDWGRSLARYGSSVLKFVEKDGELCPMVVPWNRIICDTVDFNSGLVIEKLELTPAQLQQRKGYDQEMVKKLLDTRSARTNQNQQKKDNKNDYIEVYEVHGNISKYYLTGNESDEHEYQQQMHVISFLEGKEKDTFDDYTLVSGPEKDPYMITHLIREDGRTQAIGAVEHLFEAQWMVNHSVKAIKDQLDLASKLIFQTSDGNFVGQNALSAIETGDILIHQANQPLTQVANNSHDITSLQAFGQQWQVLAKEIVSTPDAISGNTMPSGTAYRQVAILNQESHSLFEIMTENKGLAIEEMMRRFVLPHLKKKMDTSKEVAATMDSQNISQLDSMYVRNKAIKNDNDQKIEALLNGHIADNIDLNAEQAKIKESLNSQGSQRFFKPSEASDKTWKEAFKDLEWDVEVEVTGEDSDKDATLTSLTTIFQTIAAKQGQPMTDEERFIFNKILDETGVVSRLEIPQPQPQQAPPAPPQAPQMPLNASPQPVNPQSGQMPQPTR